MNRNHLWKLLLIIFVVAWAAFEIYPPNGRSIIEVFNEEDSRKDANFSNIVARAQQLQKENPNRSLFADLKDALGTNEIARYFPFDVKGEKNPNSAVLYHLQQEAAGRIKLGLDLQGGTSFLVEMDTNKLTQSSQKDTALRDAVEVLRKRVDKLGVAEPLIQPAGANAILIQLPGLSEAEKDTARRSILKAAFLEFRMVHPNSDELLSQNIIEPGYEILREQRSQPDGTKVVVPYLVSKTPATGMIGTNKLALTGSYIKRAMVSRDPVTNE